MSREKKVLFCMMSKLFQNVNVSLCLLRFAIWNSAALCLQLLVVHFQH